MHLSPFFLLATLSAAIPLHINLSPRGTGSAVIINKCNFPLYLRSVDFNHPNPGVITIKARSRHSEPIRRPTNGGGVSLKVSKTPNPPPRSITQFEYTYQSSGSPQLWYDISFVDCAVGESAKNCPGHAQGLRSNCNDGKCPELYCAPGAYCPRQIYYDPDGVDGPDEPSRSSGPGHNSMNIQYIVCDKEAPL